MAIYRLNLKKGTTVTATSDVRGTKSKAKYEYNTRSGNYAERGDLVYTEDFNFKELDYDPKKFWLMSEDRTIINYDYTSYKEFKLTLPSELSNEENIELARKFCEETFGDKFLYTISIHNPPFDNKPPNKGDKETQIHAHIMFCMKEVDLDNKMPMEQFFKYNNWRDKDRPKEFRTGGAKVNREMNSTKERINEKTGKKEPTFLDKSRKKWETILNAELEKNGIELVSCETLKKQRNTALKNGDLVKADMLNREPINKDIRLYKQKNLSNSDKELLEKENEKIAIKEEKIQIYQSLKKDINSERSKSIQVIWDSIDNYEEKINKAKKKPTAKKIEESVINVLTNKDYFFYKNQWLKEKDLIKRKELQNVMNYLENEVRNKSNFKDKIKEFTDNYDKKIKKEVTKLETEQKIIIDKLEKSDFYNPKTDSVGSVNHRYYQYQQSVASYNKSQEKNIYKTSEKDIQEKLERLERTLLNNEEFKPYRTLFNDLKSLDTALEVQNHYLKQDPGFFKKNKIKKEIVEINKKIVNKNREIKSNENYKLYVKTVSEMKVDKVNEINAKDTKTNNERNPKPIPIKEYAANEVRRKKQSNSKSEGGWSHSIEPTEIEELEKDKENER